MAGRVLSVAESDACGAAGIQADIKTILALGGYTTTAITAVTTQDAESVTRLHTLEPSFVAQQMRTVLQDIGTDAIKTGILLNEAIINAVGDVLDECQGKNIPVVIDPSMVARNGEKFLDDKAIAALQRRLFIRATVLTPNHREAELLTGMKINTLDDVRHAADMMRTLGAETVVLKAGQIVSEKVNYFVATGTDERIYERPMLKTRHTQGAGCTLSSAVAISLAQGLGVFHALERALEYMHQAILHAPGFGADVGPMNHAFDIERNSSFFNPHHVKVFKA